VTLKLKPRPTLYDTEIDRVFDASGIGGSALYLKRPVRVPLDKRSTVFILETAYPEEIHEFVINRTRYFSIRPGQERSEIGILLDKGPNIIEVGNGYDVTAAYVVSDAVFTWFYGLGRELYLAVTKRLTELQAQLASPWTSRVSSHFLPFNDVLPRARMPKIHGTRLAMTAIMGRAGFGDGARMLASGVSYQTPHIVRTRASTPGARDVYPVVTPIALTGPHFAGQEYHTWTPNYCLAAQQALFRLALNLGGEDVPDPKPLELVDYNDYGLLLKYAGQPTESHTINPFGVDCEEVLLTCNNIRAFTLVNDVFDIVMCSPQLNFDEVVVNPFLFGFWDMGYDLDGRPAYSGAAATVASKAGDQVTLTGLVSATPLDGAVVGRYIRISGAASAANNGDFLVTTFISPTSVIIQNAAGVVPDVNSGAISWYMWITPGLGGDDAHDGMDPEDPFGDGFLGISLSRRLDEDTCLDSRFQRARRLATFLAPIQLNTATPVGRATGLQLVADLKTGAPVATGGTSVFWASCPETYLREGDWIRFESPDVDVQIASAYPVFDYIIANGAGATVAPFPPTSTSVAAYTTLAGPEPRRVITAPAGFFQPFHAGKGLRVSGAAVNATVNGDWCILDVSDDGTQAIVIGRPATLVADPGPLTASVYEPLHDRSTSTVVPSQGRALYVINTAASLPRNLADEEVIDLRLAPRAYGAALLGASVVYVASDVKLLPGDLLYLDNTVLNYVKVTVAHQTAVDPISGYPVYRAETATTLPVALTDGQALYQVRTDCCWNYGDPVTPMRLFSMSPAVYLS
jgi:hypothetical protein